MSMPEIDIKNSIMSDKLSVLNPTLSVRIRPDTKVKDVIQTMVDKKIGAVLIVDDNKLVGIFSERDIIKKIADRYDEVKEEAISEFMTENPECLSINHTLAYALNRMDLGDFRHIPIIDDENRPTGIIAVRDILRYIDYKCLDGPQ